MFSIWSAIAFASTGPTQIGSTRWFSASRRITIGMFVTGSTMRPLTDISTSMGHLAAPSCAKIGSPRRLFGAAFVMRTG
jgi:hypothetical protein